MLPVLVLVLENQFVIEDEDEGRGGLRSEKNKAPSTKSPGRLLRNSSEVNYPVESPGEKFLDLPQGSSLDSPLEALRRMVRCPVWLLETR